MPCRLLGYAVAGVISAIAFWPSEGHAGSNEGIVVAQAADAYTLDPAKHSVFPTANILFHMFDALVTKNAAGVFQPALAESWSNPDPTTWQFKLRRGVKFHNGEDFDAEAVKFTFARALDPNFKAPYYSRIAAIKVVEVVDRFTVNFKTEKPFPTMLFSLYEAAFPALIVPPKYIAQNGPDALSKKPIGTGPYRFLEWRKDERVVMEAFPDYWGGAPKIKTLTWRPIPEVRTRIAELKSGGVDIIGDVPPEDIAGLDRGETKIVNVPSDFLYFYAFDTIKPSPLQDKRVRQALNYAVDVDAIQKAILNGYGQRLSVTLPKNASAYDDSVSPYPYDPAKAKALLAEAGYANGFTIPLTARQGRYLKDKEVMEATMGFLAKVGVKVEAHYLEPGVWAQVSEKKGREGLIFGGWSGLDPDLVWYPLLYTGQYQSYYSNKQLDELLDKGRSTVDVQERIALYRQAAQLIKDDAALLPMVQPPLIYGMNRRLDWQPRIDSMIDLRGAAFK
ncbi:MAG: hypothetical protein HYR63_01260 [Proteobacteria bacterium]|nr:hypothetical protein [Pseudomonadota bacterium]